MKSIIEKLKNIMESLSRPRNKKRIYVLLGAFIIVWVIYRFVMIGIERNMFVFNPARQVAESGMVVDVLPVKKTTGVLRVPLTVQNNQALVAGGRVGLLRVGQNIGDGKIVSVSSNIDIDTGLYVVRTSGVDDGLHYAEYSVTGYFVPAYAVNNNTLYVMENNLAVARTVKAALSDSDNVVITDGLSDDDMVILSRVHNGDMVQVKNKE